MTNSNHTTETPSWAVSKFAQRLKDGLVRIGQFIPTTILTVFDSCLHYLDAGKWLSNHSFKSPQRCQSRETIFLMMADACNQKSKPLYLEFGVYQGLSMKQMSQHLKGQEARLHGFDSFHGLPETWNQYNKKGHFSTGGVLPKIEDRRVTLFQGLFQDTLPLYKFPEHDFLLVNIDCDLYSSTIFVLNEIKEKIAIGSLIFFDEFYDRHHERKAFDEFLEQSKYKFELIMATQGLAHALFKRIA